MSSVILEGCDGTGKTTLAKKIANHYGWDICHCTAEDPADYEFYKQTGRKQNVVWDRHTIGELIYPDIFHRDPQIIPEDARLVLGYAREAGAKIFVLTADIDVIKARLQDRGNEHKEILNAIEWINDRFLFFADYLNVPVIDTMKLSDRQIYNMIEEKENIEFIHK